MLLNHKNCSNCGGYYDPTLKECPHCHKSNELYQERQISDKIVYFHPLAQIGLFLMGFAYVGMLVAEFIFSLFIPLFSGEELLQKTLILFFTYAMMLGCLSIIVLKTRKTEFLSKYKRPLDYVYGFAYAITVIIASLMVGSLISIFHTASDNTNQAAAVLISKNYPLIAFFVLGLFGPICEELTYRVGLYSFLRRINKYLAFAVTIIVFAFIHFDFTAIGTPDIVEELWSLPSYLVAGFILTLAYEHRGPACSMTAHILYNIFAFSMMVLAR